MDGILQGTDQELVAEKQINQNVVITVPVLDQLKHIDSSTGSQSNTSSGSTNSSGIQIDSNTTLAIEKEIVNKTEIQAQFSQKKVLLNEGIVVEIPAGTVINSDTGIVDTGAIMLNDETLTNQQITEFSKQSKKTISEVYSGVSSGNIILPDDFSSNPEKVFQFGINGKPLEFSKPVQISISTDLAEGTVVNLMVKHEGTDIWNTKGLSANKNTICTNGESSDNSINAKVVNQKVTFYTCGASTFGISVGGTCGDGIIDKNEICDDGNEISGDGCLGTNGGTTQGCELESGYVCTVVPAEGPCNSAGSGSVTQIYCDMNSSSYCRGGTNGGTVCTSSSDCSSNECFTVQESINTHGSINTCHISGNKCNSDNECNDIGGDYCMIHPSCKSNQTSGSCTTPNLVCLGVVGGISHHGENGVPDPGNCYAVTDWYHIRDAAVGDKSNPNGGFCSLTDGGGNQVYCDVTSTTCQNNGLGVCITENNYISQSPTCSNSSTGCVIQSGTLGLISKDINGDPQSIYATYPSISSDGRYNTYVTTDTNELRLLDKTLGYGTPIGIINGVGYQRGYIAGNGNRISYTDNNGDLIIYNIQTASQEFNLGAGKYDSSMSRDGDIVTYRTTSDEIRIIRLSDMQDMFIDNGQRPNISSNGEYVGYSTLGGEAKVIKINGTNNGTISIGTTLFTSTNANDSFISVASNGDTVYVNNNKKLTYYKKFDGSTIVIDDNPGVGADISDDGRYIAFASSNAILPSDANSWLDVYIYDTQSATYQHASLNNGVQSDDQVGDKSRIVISDNGQYIIMHGHSSNRYSIVNNAQVWLLGNHSTCGGSGDILNYCGDGTIDNGEICDDGNEVNGDGCNDICFLEVGASCTIDLNPADGICDTTGTGSVGVENCIDTIDNNNNGQTDCDDSFCTNTVTCISTTIINPHYCSIYSGGNFIGKGAPYSIINLDFSYSGNIYNLTGDINGSGNWNIPNPITGMIDNSEFGINFWASSGSINGAHGGPFTGYYDNTPFDSGDFGITLPSDGTWNPGYSTGNNFGTYLHVSGYAHTGITSIGIYDPAGYRGSAFGASSTPFTITNGNIDLGLSQCDLNGVISINPYSCGIYRDSNTPPATGTYTIGYYPKDCMGNSGGAMKYLTFNFGDQPATGAVCGNAIIETGEFCDDANRTNGDGCNSVCILETGAQCINAPFTGPCSTGGTGTVTTGSTSLACKTSTIFTTDFGATVANPGPALPAGQTIYTYTSIIVPQDSYYTIGRTDGPVFWPGAQRIADHTANLNGNMMIINGSFPGQAVYQKTVNLTAGTDVLFEYWVHNMDDPIYGQAAFIPAILGAQIKSGSTIIANISGYTVPLDREWHKVSLSLFSTVTGPVTIAIMSNGNAGGGNDFAIDDISITQSSCDVDIEVTKTVDKLNASLGDTLIYDVTFKNLGPTGANGQIVKDIFPTTLTSGIVISCNGTNGATCPTILPTISQMTSGVSIPILPSGGNIAFKVSGIVAVTGGTVINMAQTVVTKGISDIINTNNQASTSTKIIYITGAVCGNAIIETGEFCDDANRTNGDGCNSVCVLETGAQCINAPFTGPCSTGGTGTVEIRDDDHDGVATAVENAGPNNGDGNGDGILDSLQQEAVTKPHQALGYVYITMVTTGGCKVTNGYDFILQANLPLRDSNYEYPFGLHKFHLICGTPGQSSKITFIRSRLHDTSNWIYRKYHDNSQIFTTISNLVTYSSIIVGGVEKTTSSYSITDGGALDVDGVIDGKIYDPAGPAIIKNELPGGSFVPFSLFTPISTVENIITNTISKNIDENKSTQSLIYLIDSKLKSTNTNNHNAPTIFPKTGVDTE